MLISKEVYFKYMYFLLNAFGKYLYGNIFVRIIQIFQNVACANKEAPECSEMIFDKNTDVKMIAQG